MVAVISTRLLAGILGLGFGGIAAFRSMTEKFSIKPISVSSVITPHFSTASKNCAAPLTSEGEP